MESSDATGATGATPGGQTESGSQDGWQRLRNFPPPPPGMVSHLPDAPADESGHRWFDALRNVLAGCGCGCLAVVLVLAVSMVSVGVGAAKSVRKAIEKNVASAGKMAEDMGEDEYPYFDEIWSTGTKGSPKFVRIPLTGKIDLSEPSSRFMGDEEGSAAFALDAIRAATCDATVRGLILEIDSPGGGVTDSDILHDALMKFRAADTNNLVVVLTGDLCASGGYYVAAAADYIMAHPTTTLGSIGVIVESVNFKALADRLGVKDEPIASGKNKAMGGLFGDLNDEQRAMLQGIVDSSYNRFVKLVATGRGLPEDKVREIADGSLFSAEKALELQLVDGIGYYDDAVDEICDQIGSESIYVVRYQAPLSFGKVRNLRKLIGTSVLRELDAAATPRKAYLYGK